MSSLVSIRNPANRGNVAWKDGTEMNRESGMECDPAGDFRAFRRVKVWTCHEHGEHTKTED